MMKTERGSPMSNSIRRAFWAEMSVAHAARQSGSWDLAVHHLERAHIIGQRFFFAHLATHVQMLRIAIARRQAGEFVGQLTRLLAVLPGYLSGWVPLGNPGSARVSPVKPMPIPEDLRVHFEQYSLQREIGLRAVFWILIISAQAAVQVLFPA